MVVRSGCLVDVDREVLTIELRSNENPADLRTKIPRDGKVEFLRAETSAKYRTPFVLVRYALNGDEQKEGLRLDLDKRAFLDHFEDPSLEAALAQAAGPIAEIVGKILNLKIVFRSTVTKDKDPQSREEP